MEFVITLIAEPLIEVDSIAHLLSMQGVSVARKEWLAKGKACDLYIPSPLEGEGGAKRRERGGAADAPHPNPPPQGGREFLDSIIQDAIRGQAIDAIVQPVAGRKKKLLVADMESTIITCECLDELAEIAGIRDKIAGITARAMNGELDFQDALKERVGLLKGLPESALQEVMDKKVRLMPGARELVSTMKKNGAYCMLVSGGFDFYTNRIKEQLGFDEARANRLEISGEKLTGNVIAPILDKNSKLDALNEACAKLGIAPKDVLAVGDGANDLPMLLAAGLGVAYHAKPTVRAAAKAQINHADLRALLWAQGYSG